MKRFILFLATILSVCILNAQERCSIQKFKLYPTQNNWTFLKLNTATGEVRQIHFGMDTENRAEYLLSVPIVHDSDTPVGRFELYPTNNMYNFLLIDGVIGSVYQIQWSFELSNRLIIPITNTYVEQWHEGFTKVHDSGLCNYMDQHGNYLTDDWFSDCSSFEDGYATVKVSPLEKWNVIDTKGNYIFPVWYENIRYVENNRWSVKLNEKENIVNVHNQALLDKWYDSIRIYRDGLCFVETNGKYTVLNKNFKPISDERFDSAMNLNGKEIKVSKDSLFNIMNLQGQMLLDIWSKYEDLYGLTSDYDFSDCYRLGYVKVRTSDFKYNVLKKDGTLLFDEWFDEIKYDPKLSQFKVLIDDLEIYFDVNGNRCNSTI